MSATNAGNNSIVVTYSGSISNCGNTTLTNIMVLNNQPATNTAIMGVSMLAPNGFANFIRTYTNTTRICGSFTGVLTASGQDANNEIPGCSIVSGFAVATYGIPCISVAKILEMYELTCTTGAPRVYSVEYTDSLTEINWKVLTNFMATGSTTVIKDPAGPNQRFYRLVEYTESLTDVNWKVLTNFVGNKSFTVIKDGAGPTERFYRLVEY